MWCRLGSRCRPDWVKGLVSPPSLAPGLYFLSSLLAWNVDVVALELVGVECLMPQKLNEYYLVTWEGTME